MKSILNILFIIAVTGFISPCSLAFAETCENACVKAKPSCGYDFDDWLYTPGRGLCEGHYQPADLPFPNATPEMLKNKPTTIEANRANLKQEEPSHLEGKVHLIAGNRQIKSDEATLYRDPKTGKLERIKALGHVQLLAPDLRADGISGEYEVATEVAKLEQANFRIYSRHVRGTACALTSFGQDRLVLKDATYTTCAPCQNTWKLRAERLSLNKVTGRGRARHARLYLNNAPVFYFPYVDFPIDDRRETGFLLPNFGFTKLSGFELEVPFYWNIAPNYDATLTPQFLSKRGVNLKNQFRYMWTKGIGEINASILPNDHAYKAFREDKLINHPGIANNDPRVTALSKGNNNRTQVLVKHYSAFNPNWSGNIFYHEVGDDNYFMDLGQDINGSSITSLTQTGEVLYRDEYLNSAFRVQNYQTLHPFLGPGTADAYQRLPELATRAEYRDLPGGFVVGAGGNFTHFGHKRDPVTLQSFTTGERYQLRPSLSLPLKHPGWFFVPRLQWNLLSYSLDLGPAARFNRAPKTPHQTIPMFDLDSGLIFERNTTLCDTAYIQTLEPRLYYLHVPFRNQNDLPLFDTSNPGFDFNQLFRDNRFSGLDRVGDTEQLTYALSSRLLNGNSGEERLSATIGQIYYFKQRRVTLCNSFLFPECVKTEIPDFDKHLSPLTGILQYHLQDPWTITAAAEWDTYKRRVEKTGVYAQYHPSAYNVLNIGYLFLRHNPARINAITQLPEQLKQIDTSVAWGLTEHWRILARLNYDIVKHRPNEILGGLEHQGCCTAMRFAFIRYVRPNNGLVTQYNNGFFFQFVFKGFAGVGNSGIKSVLANSIQGYDWNPSNF